LTGKLSRDRKRFGNRRAKTRFGSKSGTGQQPLASNPVYPGRWNTRASHMRHRQKLEQRRGVRNRLRTFSFMSARCAKATKSRSADHFWNRSRSEDREEQGGQRRFGVRRAAYASNKQKTARKRSLHAAIHYVCWDKACLLRVTGDPIGRGTASGSPQPRAPELIGQEAQLAADCVSSSAADGIAKGDLARKQ
jgi:hypothetical protein